MMVSVPSGPFFANASIMKAEAWPLKAPHWTILRGLVCRTSQ
jgi:hypothetical protein